MRMPMSAIWYGWPSTITSAIARNTVYTPSWTTTQTRRGSSIVAYSATETFAGLYAAGKGAAELEQSVAADNQTEATGTEGTDAPTSTGAPPSRRVGSSS